MCDSSTAERTGKAPLEVQSRSTPQLSPDAREQHNPPSKGAVLEPKSLSLSFFRQGYGLSLSLSLSLSRSLRGSPHHNTRTLGLGLTHPYRGKSELCLLAWGTDRYGRPLEQALHIGPLRITSKQRTVTATNVCGCPTSQKLPVSQHKSRLCKTVLAN